MGIIFLLLIFLGFSALFSGAEIAFVSANKLKVELRKKKGHRRGQLLASFFENPNDFLGTMLVGNNISLVVFTFLMTRLIIPYIEHFFQNELILLLFNTALITIIILIFGEFLPKTFFRQYADDVLYFLTYPLRLLQIILWVPSRIMTRLSEFILNKVLKGGMQTDKSTFTRLDLEHFVNSSRSDADDHIDREMFGKALNLKGTRVRECMVPRPEIESIDVEAGIQELEQLFRETKLSRILVVKGDMDNVIGYVHHQQLLGKIATINQLVMKITFVPETMLVTELMNRMIKSRLNIVCVVDEFGGISGVITLEDILEEIFGEIADEYDEEEYIETVVSPDEYIFSGRLEIDYLNEKYENINFPEGDYHTLSGYLVMTMETIPEQFAEIELDGYWFKLEMVTDTKIETVRVKKISAS
jgi:putative hemolysin